MINDPRAWPEGTLFSKTVNIPSQGDLVEVEVTYIVPPFETLVELQENQNPDRVYPLFRQFIVDWDLEKSLSDYMLKCFLSQDIKVSEIIFAAWCDHMKEHIAARQLNVMQAPATIN
ncbi:hypothetical protein F3J38_18890 [Pantoea sp. Acro-805]|uniref:Uncharacterized protein n=1 Tax=Candidatus Pantoea formicae TaxID=2608355 RepID=A0ABX0QYN0_9GAMM|nr:hypothetical protein [Pantoea formicae]NIF02103.1 hypothetical protein [Pantoea formicae]